MAGNRCESCQTMVGLETGEPEIVNEDLSNGSIQVEVRLTRNCTECGTEMKETTFSFDEDVSDKLKQHEADKHEGEEQEYTLELSDADTTESGGGRYAKNMIGVQVEASVYCDGCGEGTDAVASVQLEDSIQASGFDEM